jgi:hypothetical protein
MLPQPVERLIAGLVQKFCVFMDLAAYNTPEAGGDVSPKAAASDDKAPGNADGPCDLRAGQVRCAYKNNLFCHDIVPVYWQNVYKKRSGSLTPGKGGNWGKARRTLQHFSSQEKAARLSGPACIWHLSAQALHAVNLGLITSVQLPPLVSQRAYCRHRSPIRYSMVQTSGAFVPHARSDP